MKTLTFDYTKANGDQSKRNLLVLSEPGDAGSFKGIDFSELDAEASGVFIAAAARLREDYERQLQDLIVESDLTHNFRNFLAARMSNVVTEIV